jgi:hypothetical protein
MSVMAMFRQRQIRANAKTTDLAGPTQIVL